MTGRRISSALLLVVITGLLAGCALLADASDTSLDVQYYIWRDDVTGKLLLHSLYRAPSAEDGLRWLEFNGTETVEHHHEPNTGVFKKALVYLFTLLLVEPLL